MDRAGRGQQQNALWSLSCWQGPVQFLLSNFPQPKPQAGFPSQHSSLHPQMPDTAPLASFQIEMLLSFRKSIGGISFYGFTADFLKALVGARPHRLSVCPGIHY